MKKNSIKKQKRLLRTKKKRKLFTKLKNTGYFDKEFVQVDKHQKVPLTRNVLAHIIIAVLVVYRFFLRIRRRIAVKYHF